MASCNNCIHSSVCKHRVQYVSVGTKTAEITHDCEYYKDKDEVVEMQPDVERNKAIREFVRRLKEMMEIWFYDFEYKSEKTEAIDAVEALEKEMIGATTK